MPAWVQIRPVAFCFLEFLLFYLFILEILFLFLFYYLFIYLFFVVIFYYLLFFSNKKLRQPGVEPGAKAWEASMLPIHHWRFLLVVSRKKKKKKKVFEARIELATSSVLDWRDNQLHHPNTTQRRGA